MWRGRDGLAVAAARAVSVLSRRAGHDGTALPGLAAERIAPGVATRIAEALGPVVFISGTKGKTTTSHLLVHILEQAGQEVIANRSGANLYQGLTASLIAEAGLDGRLRRAGALGVFEVDEAVLGSAASAFRVSQLVLLNLFRDQLDRYGETDAIIHRWETLCARLPATTAIVSCADDPRLAHLASKRMGPLIQFGLSEPVVRSPDLSVTADVASCPECGRRLAWSWIGVGHLGDFGCQHCGFRRRVPDIGVRVVESRGIDGQTLAVRTQHDATERSVVVGLPGVSNAYNAAAAVAAAISVGVPADQAVDALADARPAFGRYEEVEVHGRRVVLTLGKNPASLAELARVAIESGVSAILFALNDGFADGQDVSWFWDVDVAPLLDGCPYGISGARAPDFLLRLKYGASDGNLGLPPGFAGTFADPSIGLERVITAAPRGGLVFVIATYTALMRLRHDLVDRGFLRDHPR